MNDTLQLSTWQMTGKPALLSGCAYGSHSPSLVINIEGQPLSSLQRHELAQWLTSQLPAGAPNDEAAAPSGNDWHDTVATLLRAIRKVQDAAGLSTFEDSKVLVIGDNTARCQIPTRPVAASALVQAIQWLLDCFSRWPDAASRDALAAPLKTVLDALGLHGYIRSTTPHFVQTALKLDVPFIELPGQIFQYGLGRRRRLMDSTMTDHTPFIGVAVARNKQLAANTLRQAGLPVPDHRLAHDAASATQAAEALGYPVVVKPLDQDGGRGVAADLRTSEEVTQAFGAVRRFSATALVEKQIPGRDYRLVIFQGQLLWAIERIPGGVTGDGTSTVTELVARLNSDSRRGDNIHAPLKRIYLDDEALALLAREQLTPESVPENGAFVRLRRTSNVSVGGMPVAVTDQVHPDNRLLAERAALALSLDIAGVDLLIDDISQSWRDIGGTICEVNSQPNLGQTTTAHLYAPLLRQLVPGNGRIPVIVVVGAPDQSNLIEVLSRALSARLGMVVGNHDRRGLRINDTAISNGPVSTSEAARILAMDPTVDAMIVAVNDLDAALNGLPMPHHDLLLIAGSHIDTGDNVNLASAMNMLMNALLPGCDGEVITLKEAGMEVRAPDSLTSAHWREQPVPAAELMDTVVDIVAACEERHRQPPPLPENL